MSRHNFLSRETFIETKELQAKASLLSIPVFATHIHFVSESKMFQSFKFLYNQLNSNAKYAVDITILPVTDQFCRVCLKAKHIDGQSFTDDSLMNNALTDFEFALKAAINSDTSVYKPYIPKESRMKTFIKILSFASMFDNIFFSRGSSLRLQQQRIID